uniref:Uncharacterized protein n=1 Tax=Cacopsylla melanoneura TaxID=428564 RepID=A0A8D8PP96_9HEMI
MLKKKKPIKHQILFNRVSNTYHQRGKVMLLPVGGRSFKFSLALHCMVQSPIHISFFFTRNVLGVVCYDNSSVMSVAMSLLSPIATLPSLVSSSNNGVVMSFSSQDTSCFLYSALMFIESCS